MESPSYCNVQARQKYFKKMKHSSVPQKSNVYRPPNNRPHSQNIEPSTNIFINYIPSEFTEPDLKALCAPFGNIICCKIMINLETGESRCFGFVRFETLDQAQNAIRELNGKIIGNKVLLVKYAQSKEKVETISKTIYIKYIPSDIDQNYIYQLFAHYGTITNIQSLIRPENNNWRCFIQYADVISATEAIASMNNQKILVNSKPIHVHYADESRLGSIFSSTTRPIVSLPHQEQIFEGNERNLLPSFLFV